jgi:LPXTG-site transpeptidase (sortase) family protein
MLPAPLVTPPPVDDAPTPRTVETTPTTFPGRSRIKRAPRRPGDTTRIAGGAARSDPDGPCNEDVGDQGQVGGDVDGPAVAVVFVRAMSAAGILLILLVVYALFGTALLEGRTQRSLSATGHARLSIPDVGLDSLVLSGDARADLRGGPGMVPGSGAAGSDVPVVIVGSRVTNGASFRHLDALSSGARIVLTVPHVGAFTYVVERKLTTTEHAVISEPAGPQTLLLVSASPTYHDTRRLVIVSRLVTDVNRPFEPQTVRLPGLHGSVVDLVLGVTLMLFVATMWGLRASRRRWLRAWLLWGSWLPAAVLAWISWQLLLGSMSPLI